MAEPEASPLIVYGAPRSGTSYLNAILNEHPEIFITHETRVFVWAHETLKIATQEDRLLLGERRRFIRHLRSAYPGLIRSFFLRLAPGVRHWGDKNPHYASPENRGCLNTIDELFPESRFIHIVRDGRDVATSLIRRGWASFDRAHRIWLNHLEIGSSFGRAQARHRYLEIRYEDLVADDLLVAGRVFDFLGVELHPDVVRFCHEQRSDRSPIQSPTRNLGSGASASDWSQILAPDQQLRSLKLIGKQLVEHRYETEQSLAVARQQLTRRARSATPDPLTRAVRACLPSDATVIVVTGGEDRLLLAMDGRRAWHMPQTERGNNTHTEMVPADSRDAIAQVKRLQTRGANFLVFPAQFVWWLDKYEGLRDYLEKYGKRLWSNEDCIIYDLPAERAALARRGQRQGANA